MANDLVAQIASLTAEGAERAIMAAEAAARELGYRLSIAVVDRAGSLLAFKRMDGAIPVSVEVSVAKAATAAMIGTSTMTFQELIEGGRICLLSIRQITPVRGGLPIIAGGEIVGAIGCSGELGEQDEYAARAGCAAIDWQAETG